MATARLYNLARMTTATTGTGTVTLGSAVTGFLSFASAGVADGATVTYAIKDGNNSEMGRGVYTSSGTTLTRATILNSTNSNNALNLTGSAEVFLTPSAQDFYPVVNAQSGTTYTVLATDVGKLVTFSNAASIAVTLPQATGLFGTGFWFYVQNIGAGTVTITPTTSTLNGAATLVLRQGEGALIVSDGANYQAIVALTPYGARVSVASASTCDIGAASSNFVEITGTTTITSLGTAAAGVWRDVTFASALTLTHNGTSLLLPGAANITTAANDRMRCRSLGSGNWIVLDYTRTAGDFVLGTPVASTSGTAIDFTGLPAGVKRVTVALSGVSTNGTNNLLVQLGDSGGVETTGYTCGSGIMLNAAGSSTLTSTAGFIIITGSASNVNQALITISLVDASTNTWAAGYSYALSSSAVAGAGSGSKSLSATLDRIRITTVGGTDTFDAGTINISYEG